MTNETDVNLKGLPGCQINLNIKMDNDNEFYQLNKLRTHEILPIKINEKEQIFLCRMSIDIDRMMELDNHHLAIITVIVYPRDINGYRTNE